MKYDIRVEKQSDFLQRVAPNMVDKTRIGYRYNFFDHDNDDDDDGHKNSSMFSRWMKFLGIPSSNGDDNDDQRYSPMIHDFSNCSVLTITPIIQEKQQEQDKEYKEEEDT